MAERDWDTRGDDTAQQEIASLKAEVKRLKALVAECEADHPPEAEYLAWCKAGMPDVKALERERDEARARADAAAALRDDALKNCKMLETKIETARALHQKDHSGHCETCDEVVEPEYPCNTHKALTGGRE